MIVFHVGFPKAASTTLQKALFDRHPDINYLGMYPTSNIGVESQISNLETKYLNSKFLQNLHHLMTNIDGIEFYNNDLNDIRNEVAGYLSEDKINIFSNERFTSVFFANRDRVDKARRIKELFPDSKILIMIRNQMDIIKSQYRDYPFDPRDLYVNRKRVSIDKWIKLDLSSKDTGFLQSIDYYKLYLFYESVFGSANVKIMLFERLKYDTHGFSKELSEYLNIEPEKSYELLNGVRENTAVSDIANSYRALKYKFISFLPSSVESSNILRIIDKRIMGLLKIGKAKKIKIDSTIMNLVDSQFSESNSALEKKIGIELGCYGYPTNNNKI
jgi:hypothetical protein